MQNYVLIKMFVLGIIIIFIGTSVLPIVNGNEFESNASLNISTIVDRDQIDQSQLDIDNAGQVSVIIFG